MRELTNAERYLIIHALRTQALTDAAVQTPIADLQDWFHTKAREGQRLATLLENCRISIEPRS